MNRHFHLIAFAGLIVFAILIGIYIERQWKRFAFQIRVKRGREAEKDAYELFKRQGFMVLDQQISTRVTYLVDGIAQESTVRADYLVSKDGKTYIAEVKSGGSAPNPTYPQTRRQLLEYALLFHNPNLLLVDMEAEEIREIQFPALDVSGHTPWPTLGRTVAWSLAIGAALGIYLGLKIPHYLHKTRVFLHHEKRFFSLSSKK